jgi:Pyridoxal-dependent decarboxylase, pyridoxal binding domain
VARQLRSALPCLLRARHPRQSLAFKEVFERLYPKGEVRYAGKASTHPAVFRLAAAAGVGIDVASPYETRCALEAGVSPEKLDVNGNAKDDGLLNRAIAKDMLIIVDSNRRARAHCRARAGAAANAEGDVARDRVQPRQRHGSCDLHGRRVEQVRHRAHGYSPALAAPRTDAGQGPRLPHPYRQSDQRSRSVSARSRQAARVRRHAESCGTRFPPPRKAIRARSISGRTGRATSPLLPSSSAATKSPSRPSSPAICASRRTCSRASR